MSAARVTLEVRLRDEWPGDDDFDLWAREVFRHRLAQIAAIDSVEVVSWDRLLDPSEEMPT